MVENYQHHSLERPELQLEGCPPFGHVVGAVVTCPQMFEQVMYVVRLLCTCLFFFLAALVLLILIERSANSPPWIRSLGAEVSPGG